MIIKVVASIHPSTRFEILQEPTAWHVPSENSEDSFYNADGLIKEHTVSDKDYGNYVVKIEI